VAVDGNRIGSVGALMDGFTIVREAVGADNRVARRWAASVAWS
jgi:hypothetical protein